MYEQPLQDLALGVAIDQSPDRTQTAGAFARKPAWHRFGDLVDSEMSVDDGLRRAHLDWEVTQEPLTTAVLTRYGVTQVEVPGSVANVAIDPFTGVPRVLGVVGAGRPSVQNRELGEWGHDILGASGGAQLSSLGSFKQMRKVFMSLRMPESIKVGGQDAVDFYLGLVEHHDGEGSLTAVISAVRFECRNTVTAGVRGAATRVSIRHTSSMPKRMAQARELLNLTTDYTAEFGRLADDLLQIELTDLQFFSIVEDTFGKRPKDVELAPVAVRTPAHKGAAKAALTRWDNRYELLKEERSAPQNAFGPGTGWNALNGITSYLNFAAWTVGDTPAQKQDARSAGVLLGYTDPVVRKAISSIERVGASA